MRRSCGFGLVTLLLCSLAEAAPPVSVEVKGTGWVDSGVDVLPGAVLRVTATGSASAKAQTFGPEGLRRSLRDIVLIYPVNDANRGALVGRIGSSDAARPFKIGASAELKAPVTGRLFLSLNLPQNESPEGSFQVSLEVVSAGAATPAPAGASTPITAEILAQIPIRVEDKDGNPGDRVNFLIVGSEQQVTAALKAAGWNRVDKNVEATVARGLLDTLLKQAYLTMPMSELFLFGRGQDYGFAQGDPVRVVASRHHFRIWKAPVEAGGRVLWAGAGTHDIGFDKDQRNGKVTHKIDPDTDKEREYIGESLKQTGAVAGTQYVTPATPLTKARTAHGEEFFSDGRILVISLRDAN